MSHSFALARVFGRKAQGLKGNTAAVVLQDTPLPEAAMQATAADFNQPATSFLVPDKKKGHYRVRWFAPDSEIGLCGHGAAAAAIFLHRCHGLDRAVLHYREGRMEVGFREGHYYLFTEPLEIIDKLPVPPALEAALGLKVLNFYSTPNKHLVLVEKEAELRAMQPNFAALAQLEPFGYVVTAPGQATDFVSRTLVPKVQQLEDHATGSSHAVLTPFWAERLPGKSALTGEQLSARGGYFHCSVQMNRVLLQGEGALLAEGNFNEP